MTDMLVRLWKLPEGHPCEPLCWSRGFGCASAIPLSATLWPIGWDERFSPKWVSECKVAMGHQPVGCFIATQEKRIIGFVCYDATARGFIGPMGVDPEARQGGIGKAMLVTALEQMRALGYAYAVIGGVGPAEFYSRCVGATVIEDSSPGIYEDILPDPPKP